MKKISARLAVTGIKTVSKRPLLVSDKSQAQTSPEFSTERTPSALVNSIMALLATFDTVNILPPEGTSQANQLIHSLIQLQSALVKSQSPELDEYVLTAIAQRAEMKNERHLQPIQQNGLTTKILEALLLHDKEKSMWHQPALVRILQRYNFSRSDWQLIQTLYAKAEEAFRVKGSSIHKIYEQWRSRMRRDG